MQIARLADVRCQRAHPALPQHGLVMIAPHDIGAVATIVSWPAAEGAELPAC